MIHFKKIRYKNFLSTGNQWNEIQLDQYKSTLLCGKNGSGKSTITDAICFALYGKPFRKINKPQLINNITKSNLLVEIEFETNSKEYKIIRGMKPNVFEIYENGKLINQDAQTRDYQEFLITNILKMSYKTFTQIVIIGSATYSPFMKLNPNDRRIIVEDLLEIDIFSKMNVLLKDRIARANTELDQINFNVSLTEKNIQFQKELLEKNKQNIEEQLQENQRLIKETEEKIEEKQSEIYHVQKERKLLLKENTELNELKEKAKKIFEYQISLKNKKTQLEKEIKYIESNDVCVMCNQDITEEYKINFLTKKRENERKINEGLDLSITALNDLNKKIAEIQQQIEQANELDVLQLKLESEIEQLQKFIQKIQNDTNRLLEDKSNNLKELEEQFEQSKNELLQLTKKRNQLLNEQQLNAIASVLLKDDGIKTKIIRYYLPTINKLINKYLQAMDFFINFNLTENFEEEVQNKAVEGFCYESFSEGEKLRIDLAILFAWRELSKIKNKSNCNLLILDEVFDSSLDTAGVDDFLKIIHQVSDHSNVFVISHKDEQIFDRFDNVLKFEKIGAFTKIS
jgi:DNA repair exonuclease SbcCD ATPase subunit